ncbi:MAG: redoxin domain-containing protein [Isosphaeraceae bacterium]
MRKTTRLAYALLLTTLASLYGFTVFRSMREREADRYVPPLASTPSHTVTPRMSDASDAMQDRLLASFQREGSDGKTYDLKTLLDRGPVVLTFTKVGCPCSVAAQPFFNQVALAFPGVTVLGVVNAEQGPARLWAERIQPVYPQLLDPDETLIQACGVENSAYVVVVGPDGRIVGHWPGISQAMLHALGNSLAHLTGTQPTHALDVREAPEEMYTGCPFLKADADAAPAPPS